MTVRLRLVIAASRFTADAHCPIARLHALLQDFESQTRGDEAVQKALVEAWLAACVNDACIVDGGDSKQQQQQQVQLTATEALGAASASLLVAAIDKLRQALASWISSGPRQL
jgi:hypothetical protein